MRIRDLARTEIGKRSYDFRVDLDGKPGVNVGVYLQTGANAMDAAALVKAKLTELAEHFPEGSLSYIITDDTTVFVSAVMM